MSALQTVILVSSQSLPENLNHSVQRDYLFERTIEKLSLVILFSMAVMDFVVFTQIQDAPCQENRFYIFHRNQLCTKVSQVFFIVLGFMCLAQTFKPRHEHAPLATTRQMALCSAFHVIFFVLFNKEL